MSTFTISVCLPSVTSQLTHLASTTYVVMMSISLNLMDAVCPYYLTLQRHLTLSTSSFLKCSHSFFFFLTPIFTGFFVSLLGVPYKLPFLALSPFPSL